jgi:hypothetical protein
VNTSVAASTMSVSPTSTRTFARGLARSASIARRLRTACATSAASASRTGRRPRPPRRLRRINAAATRSVVDEPTSDKSSAKARNAASAPSIGSRDASAVTSG